MPVMWAFMDLAATEWKVPYRDLWHFGSAAFLLDGLTIWLVICPLIKDGVVLVGKLTKARGSTPCWEVLKNLLLTAMFAIPAEIIQGIYIILFASSFPPVVPRPFCSTFWTLPPFLLHRKFIMTIPGAGFALLGLRAVLCAAISWFHPRPESLHPLQEVNRKSCFAVGPTLSTFVFSRSAAWRSRVSAGETYCKTL